MYVFNHAYKLHDLDFLIKINLLYIHSVTAIQSNRSRDFVGTKWLENATWIPNNSLSRDPLLCAEAYNLFSILHNIRVKVTQFHGVGCWRHSVVRQPYLILTAVRLRILTVWYPTHLLLLLYSSYLLWLITNVLFVCVYVGWDSPNVMTNGSWRNVFRSDCEFFSDVRYEKSMTQIKC